MLSITKTAKDILMLLIASISILLTSIRFNLFGFKRRKEELEDSAPRILGTGRANGTYKYRQDFLAKKLLELYPHLDEEEHNKVRHVFKKTGIESCTSCCPEELLFKNMGKAQWVEHVKQSHLQMGAEAMEKAISAWGGNRKEITHFIWATSTSSQHPNRRLIALDGFRALAVANDLVRADPMKHVVLIVCAEARSSLGNAMPDPATAAKKIQRNALVQAALFRDGASAAIIGSTAFRNNNSFAATSSNGCELAIIKSKTFLVPGTLENGVNTQEFEDNFIRVRTIMTIPAVVGLHAVKLMNENMATLGIRKQELLLFLHPASYATVSAVVPALGLKPEQAQVTYDCVKTAGNLGGATNLYVVDRWLREHPKMMSKYNYALCVAPAAGITFQGVLLQIVHRDDDDDDNDEDPGLLETTSENSDDSSRD